MSPGWREFLIAFSVLLGFIVLYFTIAFSVGYITSLKPVCPRGYRAVSVDGSKSLVPKDNNSIVVRTADYPTCSSMMTCPQWAIHEDGSALTNTCDNPGCPCADFQHCPAYASTLFRKFGEDDRISLFQVIDPQAKEKDHPKDPYDTPYILFPGLRDSCYLTPNTLPLVWPPIALGDACLQGTLGKIKTTPSLYVCAPTQYVTKDEFDVAAYMTAYRPHS